MGKKPRPEVTRLVEDYVTLIWKAHEWPGCWSTTTDLATQLGVTASTVSANLKKLAGDGYIDYEPYGRIGLTEKGRAIAVETVRRHRIVETYLVQQLGLTWDQVHVEADRLEHVISDLVLERMNTVLGFPTRDPHGDPIPGADGRVDTDLSRPLTEASNGEGLQITRVSDRSPGLLRYLRERGMVVDAHLRVLEVNADAAVVRVRVAGVLTELSTHAAAAVRVRPNT